MTEDEIRYAAEALGVIPRSKTRPKSFEVPKQRPTGALAQTQQTISEGIKSARERREAEESEAWGQEVAERATLPQKIMGGLEATAALPAAAITGALGHLGEGFKLLPPGGGTEFVKEKTLIPHGEAGQYYFDVMAGGLEKAADWFGETPLGELLGSAVDKLPSIFPVSATTAKAIDEGIVGAGKGLKLAAEQARKQRQYETGQEGAFYRVRPVTEETGRALRGNKEEAGGGAETPGGSVRGDVPQPITDDALTKVMAQPDNFVRSVASDYAQQVNGRPYELPDMAPSSLLKQAPIGRVFDLAVSDNPQYKKAVFEAYGRSMPEVIEQSGAKNYDQLVEAAYRQLAKETDDQFRRLPVNMSYHRAGEGNYSDSRDMLRDVYGNRHLYVFQGGDPHPFLSRVDPETGLNDNEKFRAVHDFFGHAIHGNQFGPKGEETAWLAHSQMYSPLARLAMSTETRGQNSVVNYTPLNAKLKARLSEIEGRIYEARRRGQTDDLKELQDIKKGLFEQFQFAPQYGLLLPPEMIRPDFAGKMPDYVRPLIQPAPGTATGARLFHYGKEPGIKVTDPSRYGTGIKGAEASRLEGAEDIRPRTYFYTDPTKPPEAGLGPYRYTGEADLYNLEEDPLALRTLAAESLRSPFTAKVNPGMVDPGEAITATERLVKEYGYPGYMTPESGTAAVFQPVPVQQYAEGGAVNPFEVPTPENLALDPILAEEREMRRLKRAQEMAQRPLAEKAKGALEAAQTTASTVGRGVLRPFAELAGQAFGEKGMGERLVQSAPQPQTEVGKHYAGEVQDVMQEVGKFLEPAKIPQGPYMPELIPSLPYVNRPQMLTQKLEEEFAKPPIGAVQLQTQQAQRNPLGMYSQAEQVALNLAQEKGTGNQFLAQISKAPGVKPAELEWTGLADFLKGKGDQPVTKKEIQQHLDANRVQVEEVILGSNPRFFEDPKISQDVALLRSAGYEPDINPENPSMFGFVSEDGDILDANEIGSIFSQPPFKIADAAQRVQDFFYAQGASASYKDLQLPGGSNYREVLLTLPEQKSPYGKFLDYVKEKYGKNTPRSQWSDEDNKTYEKLTIQQAAAGNPNFQSTHFNQPNILAHMRLNDRVDANGDKVLFVEEMQSDWGQQGRERGFADNRVRMTDLTKQYDALNAERRAVDRIIVDGDDADPATQAAIDRAIEINNEMNALSDRMTALRSGTPSAPFVSTQQYQVMKDGKPLVTKNKENKDVQHIYDSPEDAQRAAQKFGGDVKDLGMQENTEGWLNLSLKRLITDAVNNGYKKVAFINGEQSAKRYGLAGTVDAIQVTPSELRGRARDQLQFVDLQMSGGQQPVELTVNKNGIVINTDTRRYEQLRGKPLSEVLGKEMSEKIMTGGAQVIKGEGLEVGGEGMKKFYDQIVPATANKLLKKLGGGKLEPMQIGDNQQLGFTITPEMVELVKKQGLPMFAAGGAVTMAKGGKVAKGMSGISAAREAMRAQRQEAADRPKQEIIHRDGKKLSSLSKGLKQADDRAALRRLERIADEAPYSVERLEEEELRRALSGGDNSTSLAIIRPEDFRYLADQLPEEYLNSALAEKMSAPAGVSVKEYIRHLGGIAQQQGFRDIPLLQYGEHLGTSKLGVTSHEGRHRMRALEGIGDEKALVRLFPASSVREPLPRRSRSEFLEALSEKYGSPLRLDPEGYESVIIDMSRPVEPFKKGGKVTKGALSGLSSAREAMKAKRREERVQKNLEAYMGSAEKPQTYYHATQAPKDFRKFDLEKRPTPKSAAAVFLTPSTDWANEFDMADLKTLESATSAAPRIMPMITRAKNTFDYENPEHVQQVMSKVQVPKAYTPEYVAEQIGLGNWNFIEDMKVQQAIKDLGFDSFHVKEKGVKNLGVFNPADVKALFNRGSYDPTTEDISKAEGGPVYQGIAKFREARKEARMAIGGSASKKKGSLLSSVSAAREAQKAQRVKDTPEQPAAPAIITPKRAKPGQTVINPVRMAFPGIYKRPDVIAREAAERAAPESPNLKDLFGVTREDLYQIARGRQGNLPGILPGLADKPKGMRGGAEQITNKRNTQRILDANAEAERYPQLYKGMDAWYVMDPLYQAFERELGPERAKIEYDMMNKFMGMASPGSEVTTEIPRGSSAYYLHKQGRFPEFVDLLGKPFEERGADFPEDIRTVPGHVYHSTAQAGPMQKFVDKGELDMDSPKVPMYIEASGVPEVGFQTETPVGDAHYSRAIGLGDIRKAKNFGKSASTSEMYSLIPWWREKIAGELGIRPVSAQGRTWGVFSPQTGVTTPVGATKLELISDQIVEAARRMNVTPQDALRMFIHGEARLGKKKGGLVALER